VILLANAFLRCSSQQHRRNLRFSAEALAAIANYAWPGNIRELENSVHRAVILAAGRFIQPADLGLEPVPVKPPVTLKDAKNRAEREVLMDVLVRTRGNITRAAKELEISRPTFHDLLEKHQMAARAFRA
jgi:two-component system NtrC family response regulator